MILKVPPNPNHSLMNLGMEKAKMRPAVAKGITITKAESGIVPVKPSWRPLGSLAALFWCMNGTRTGVLMSQPKSQ